MRDVFIPAGPSMLDTARWIGTSIRHELEIYEGLNRALGEASSDVSAIYWRLRSHRANSIRDLNDRLPLLQEFPRQDFVDGDIQQPLISSAADGSETNAERSDNFSLEVLVERLGALKTRYSERLESPLGPADAPLEETLRELRKVLASDEASLGFNQTSA